jgi:hypothetical protein
MAKENQHRLHCFARVINQRFARRVRDAMRAAALGLLVSILSATAADAQEPPSPAAGAPAPAAAVTAASPASIAAAPAPAPAATAAATTHAPATVRHFVGVTKRVSTMALFAALLIVVAAAATGGRPWRFLIGVDNRYSNSQCQLALWFGAVATVYATTVALRVMEFGFDYLGNVAIPAHVAALTGLSALTFGGAKIITVQKVDTAAQAGLAPAKSTALKPHLLTDLFVNDKGAADLGDFQMILITVVAVIIFMLTALHQLGTLLSGQAYSLPDIDTSLLTSFGIGQGAYLVKKAALKAGDG